MSPIARTKSLASLIRLNMPWVVRITKIAGMLTGILTLCIACWGVVKEHNKNIGDIKARDAIIDMRLTDGEARVVSIQGEVKGAREDIAKLTGEVHGFIEAQSGRRVIRPMTIDPHVAANALERRATD